MSFEASELGSIASIWAHPDDETFLAGGIMAAAADNGQPVVCVSATAGERGTDDPVTWPPERLGRMRQWEAAAAMAVLGVADHRFLGYPDGGLADLDPGEPIDRIAAILDEGRPDTILTFGPDGMTYHSDHQAVSAWVGKAWERTGRRGRLLHAAITTEHAEQWLPRYEEWGVFMTDERPAGLPAREMAVYLRNAGNAMDRKFAALAAMYTQIAPSIKLLGEELFRALNEEEAFRSAV